MSIRIEVNRLGAKKLVPWATVERRGNVRMLNTAPYQMEVKTLDETSVQIVIPTSMEGVRLTMTSCDLMDLIQRTFNGTMQIVGAAGELGALLQRLAVKTTDDASTNEQEFENEGEDEPEAD